MAASHSSPKTHFNIPKSAPTINKITNKPHSNSLNKPLTITFILLVIILFPSQPPGFMDHTMLTELWEIIRLLFIGLAVAYGLFSRKRAENVAECSDNNSRTGDPNEYLPGISHLNSVFQNGFENFADCGYLQSSDDQFLGEKIRSLVSNDGDEGVYACDTERVTRVCRSRYLKGESLVVVENGIVDECNAFRSLNLPVRSLRKSVVENDGLGFDDGDEFGSRFGDKGGINDEDDVNVVKIRGVVPMNLEKRFKEVAGITWRSRSARDERGGETSDFAPLPRVRPQSVGEFEFEQLKSKTCSLQCSNFSGSPELASLQVENGRRKNDIKQLGISFSRPKIVPLDVETSLDDAKTRLSNFEYSTNESDEKQGVDFLGSDNQSEMHAKALSKAKSVRTIKASIKDKKRRFRQFEANSLVKRGTEKEREDCSIDKHLNRDSDSIFPMPKPRPFLPEIRNERNMDIDGRNDSKSDENSWSDLESVEEFEGSEVDRKAGEFIAKFRAQISLQKTLSSKGLDGW